MKGQGSLCLLGRLVLAQYNPSVTKDCLVDIGPT